MSKRFLKNMTMTPRQRLDTVFAGHEADKTPVLGGWIACPQHICSIAGVGREEYWRDPVKVSIEAYRILGTDGLIDIFVPHKEDDFRCVDASSYAHANTDLSLEDTINRIDAMPSAEDIESQFNFEQEYSKFKAHLIEMQQRCGDMVYMPAQWDAGAVMEWYFDFGYNNFFYVVGLYPDRAIKLMEVGGAIGYCRSVLVAKAVEEGLYPHAVLLGEDICTQRGPMISPDFIEKYYAPQLQRGLKPLLDVGCKPVWHSDGDIRPIMDMLIDCGVQGFQGFQPECGLTIDYVVQKRTREGKPLLIFGPLAVTTELPVCTPQEVKAKVRHAIDVCRGNANLVLFTSNTINPDVPLENIKAMYEATLEE